MKNGVKGSTSFKDLCFPSYAISFTWGGGIIVVLRRNAGEDRHYKKKRRKKGEDREDRENREDRIKEQRWRNRLMLTAVDIIEQGRSRGGITSNVIESSMLQVYGSSR